MRDLGSAELFDFVISLSCLMKYFISVILCVFWLVKFILIFYI